MALSWVGHRKAVLLLVMIWHCGMVVNYRVYSLTCTRSRSSAVAFFCHPRSSRTVRLFYDTSATVTSRKCFCRPLTRQCYETQKLCSIVRMEPFLCLLIWLFAWSGDDYFQLICFHLLSQLWMGCIDWAPHLLSFIHLFIHYEYIYNAPSRY